MPRAEVTMNLTMRKYFYSAVSTHAHSNRGPTVTVVQNPPEDIGSVVFTLELRSAEKDFAGYEFQLRRGEKPARSPHLHPSIAWAW